MTRMVQCVKLGKEAEGLERQPYPGELGKRIFDNVSKEGWQLWLRQQTMLINEYRLMPASKEGQEIIAQQMEQFFFGAGSQLPPNYVPPQKKS